MATTTIRISRKKRSPEPDSLGLPSPSVSDTKKTGGTLRRLPWAHLTARQRLVHVLTLPLQLARLLAQRYRALPVLSQLYILVGVLVLGYLAWAREARMDLLCRVSFGRWGQDEWDRKMEWPPRYRDVIRMQAALPQHNASLAYPEGAGGRYVRFTSQIRELGWNNVFNEILLLTLLAQKSGRTYVFEDYVWKQSYYPWSRLKAHRVPSRTPLPALISGPTAGGSWGTDPAYASTPRSVHDDFFNTICPPEKRVVIWTHHTKKKYNLYEKSATEIFETWRKILEDEPARCVEVAKPGREVEDYAQVFDLWLWGSERILDIWEVFRDSAVSRMLGPSPIVSRAVWRNQGLFYTNDTVRGPGMRVERPFGQTFAVHLRRGDFKGACQSLADWRSSFYSWNQLAWLPDRFPELPGGVPGKNTPENVRKYFERCLPDMDRIIARINGARDDYEKEVYGSSEKHKIKVLFVLTNDRTQWFQDFRKRLEAYDWKIVTTHDLVLINAQEKDVAMVVDMEIAIQSAMFIGNGWSSFTSNIIHRRLVDEKIPISNRFF